MRTAIIGAGPAGLVLGRRSPAAAAEVTLVDRDPGPPSAGVWARKGVMQFHHAHAIRAQVVGTLRRELPEAYERLLAVGAEPVEMPLPDGASVVAGSAVPAQHLRAGRPRRRGHRAGSHASVPATSTASPRRRLPGPPRHRARRRRPAPRGRPRRRRLRPVRTGEPGPARADVGRGSLRDRLRRPRLPAGARRRARPPGEPHRLAGELRRLPVPRLPARTRHLLRAGHPLDRRP